MGRIARNVTDGTFMIQFWAAGAQIYSTRDASFQIHVGYGTGARGEPWWEEIFYAIECEPVIVEFASGVCLPHRRIECKCAGY